MHADRDEKIGKARSILMVALSTLRSYSEGLDQGVWMKLSKA